MFRAAIVATTVLISMTLPSVAACYGTGTFKRCYDLQSGNSYNIQQFGNTTQLSGSNAGTGSMWSQRSTTYGNTTQHTGIAGNGNSWSITQRNNGYSTTYSGWDSNGNAVLKTCTSYGCY